jgi:hypothetical protein
MRSYLRSVGKVTSLSNRSAIRWCYGSMRGRDSAAPAFEHSRVMLTVLGGLAEFERELIKVRTSEGRVRAKARGVHMGGLGSEPEPAARGPDQDRGRRRTNGHRPHLRGVSHDHRSTEGKGGALRLPTANGLGRCTIPPSNHDTGATLRGCDRVMVLMMSRVGSIPQSDGV